MDRKSKMELIVESSSENERFVRTCVAAFAARLDPTMEELDDIRTAVSEAVTNCIIHGYEGLSGEIRIRCEINDGSLIIKIEDFGIGIEDVGKAMEPMYTSKPEQERSGMGFSFMDAFMDELAVTSEVGNGTLVVMKKIIRKAGSYGYSGTDQML